MDVPSPDWSTAEARGDRVTVRITGERPKGWKQSFLLAASLLAADTPFGEISMKGDAVTIGGLRPGDEDGARFLLEGAVQQANADHPTHDDSGDDDDGGAETDGPDADPDQEMTERFRSFAGEETP